MMKKAITKFLATGMAALTLMTTAVAFTPATQVFAETIDTESNCVSEEIIFKKDLTDYISSMVPNGTLCESYDNTKIYRMGNKMYSFSTYEAEPAEFKHTFSFPTKNEVRRMLDKMYVFDDDLDKGCNICDGNWRFASLYVTGKIARLKVVTKIYDITPVETVKISASRTMIHSGEWVSLSYTVNEGADESTVNWRVAGAEGCAEVETYGNEAFVTGYGVGTVMIVAETEDGVRDFVHIDIVD